jgi:hypothetical protein
VRIIEATLQRRLAERLRDAAEPVVADNRDISGERRRRRGRSLGGRQYRHGEGGSYGSGKD